MRTILEPGSWKRALWPGGLLLGLPLILRLLCLLQLHGSEMFRLLVVDARTYHDMAAALATGRWDQTGPFWQPPFYPIFLALLYKLATPDPLVARIAQTVLGSISCILIYRLGSRFFGRRAGWIAWGIASTYGPFLFFDLQILNASLVTLLLLAVLDIVTAGTRTSRLLLSGFAAGLAAITVATSLVAVPVVAAWIVWSRRRAWVAAGIFLAAAAVPIATVTAVNFANCGEVVLISYNGGINFWIGNNPDYERTVAIRPGRSWDALDKELRLAGVPTAAQSSSYWFRKSLGWISSHPSRWLGLIAHKKRLFFRGDEIARNQEIYPFRQSSAILRALLWIRGVAFPFGLLLPVAAAGIVTLWIRRRESRKPAVLLFALLVVYSAAVILFFPAGRYRIPIVPCLILFAAGGASEWLDSIRRKERRSLILPAAIAIAALLFSNWGLPSMPSRFNSDAYSDLGFSYQERRDFDRARRDYEIALEVDPANMEALNNLGTILLIQGKTDQAKPYFRRILEAYPTDRKALSNMGTIYLKNSEPYRAGDYYSRALESDRSAPNAAEGIRLAADMAARLEAQRMETDPEAFLRLLEGYFRDEPQNGFLYERLLALLEGRGLTERALAVVRARLMLRPNDSDVRLTAARLIEKLGRPTDARRVLEGALP